MRRIIVCIERDGQTSVTAEGFNGSDCRVATEFLGQALGNVMQENLTSDFYEHTTTASTQQENRL